MEVTDKKYAEELEFDMAKTERIAKRRKKRANGVFGKLISMVNHLTARDKKNVVTITDTIGWYGRAGNRIYLLDSDDNYVLFKKCKNSTKAKKFMEGQR